MSTNSSSPKWTNEELLILTEMFLEATASELDPYTSEKSIIKVENKYSVSLEIVDYIQFAKYGRGPGKNPPFQDIYEWVKKEGIKFEDSTFEGTAFAIQKSISLHGTLNYVPNAPDALEEALTKRWKEYQVDLSKSLLIKVDSEINRIYKNIDYSKIIK